MKNESSYRYQTGNYHNHGKKLVLKVSACCTALQSSDWNNGGRSKVSRWEHLCLICRREENTRKINSSRGRQSPDTTRTEGTPRRKACSNSYQRLAFFISSLFCGASTRGEMRCQGKRELGFYLLEMLCRVKARIELIMFVF